MMQTRVRAPINAEQIIQGGEVSLVPRHLGITLKNDNRHFDRTNSNP